MTHRPAGQFSTDDKTLLASAAEWEHFPHLRDCSSQAIAEISGRHGLEFSTAVLYDRVARRPDHCAVLQRIQSDVVPSGIPTTVVGIVPGAFYREHNNTGADGARLVALTESLSCDCELVPVESFGSLARNAFLIGNWLAQHRHERVVLVSLSKGSADMKVALALPEAAELFRNVTAWISVSGLTQGTPLVAWLRRHRLRRMAVSLLLLLRGQRYSVVEELRDEVDGPLSAWPPLPAHLRVIHVVAFPLRRHLTHPWASRAYERLAWIGPNDGGGFLLAEVANLPGVVLPVWGADHYLQPGWDSTPLLRGALVEALASPVECRQASQSAAQPKSPPANKSNA